jgi:hypothetical protein
MRFAVVACFAYPAGAANTTVVKISKKTLDLITGICSTGNRPNDDDRHRAHGRPRVSSAEKIVQMQTEAKR